MMNNQKRAAQCLCNAKNALSSALFELEQAGYEGARVPSDWSEKIRDIRNKINW